MSSSNIIVKCVEIHVPAENIEEFIEVTEATAVETRKEAGNLRFEIHQSVSDPTKFFFFEAYLDEKAIQVHKATAYYKSWCEVAEPLMAGTRKTTNCKIIFSDQL